MTPALDRSTAPFDSLIGACASDRTGIVHLGLGNFHRAHAAVYTAQAMAAAGGDWGIRGFAHSSSRVVDPMRAQDNLYSVLQLTESGASAGLIDVHRNSGVASADPDAVIGAISDPAHRIVTLTVSEAGYTRDPATGDLAVDSPAIAAEIAGTTTPRSTIGLIARGLSHRAQTGEPMTILSCDNLQSAGDVTRNVVTQYLDATGAPSDVVDFVASSVTFPNGMVDRIVPKTTDAHSAKVAELLGITDLSPVPAEEFSMWVLEDNFAAGRPSWESAGALFTDEVEAYELVKLRLLNGSHSLIAYLGVLSDAATIDAAWSLDFVQEAVIGGIEHDYLPTITLPAGFDVKDYIAALDARWRNSLIGHATTQVASDGSLKLLQRIPEAALFNLERGTVPHSLALCTAAWIACVAPPLGFSPGPLAASISEPATKSLAEAVSGATTIYDHVHRIIDGGFFPSELAGHDTFTTRVTQLLTLITSQGPQAAVADISTAR